MTVAPAHSAVYQLKPPVKVWFIRPWTSDHELNLLMLRTHILPSLPSQNLPTPLQTRCSSIFIHSVNVSKTPEPDGDSPQMNWQHLHCPVA